MREYGDVGAGERRLCFAWLVGLSWRPEVAGGPRLHGAGGLGDVRPTLCGAGVSGATGEGAAGEPGGSYHPGGGRGCRCTPVEVRLTALKLLGALGPEPERILAVSGRRVAGAMTTTRAPKDFVTEMVR